MYLNLVVESSVTFAGAYTVIELSGVTLRLVICSCEK